MSDKKWKFWTIELEGCYLGDTFEVHGNPVIYQEVCHPTDGTVLFTVKENEYPDGTLFDVVLHVTPKKNLA